MWLFCNVYVFITYIFGVNNLPLLENFIIKMRSLVGCEYRQIFSKNWRSTFDNQSLLIRQMDGEKCYHSFDCPNN